MERGITRILGFQLLKRNADGTVVGLKAEERHGGSDPAAGLHRGRGTYENTWAIPFVRSVRSRGGRVVSSGRVGVEELLAALRTAPGGGTEPAS